jgi:sialate O-acetylesterase
MKIKRVYLTKSIPFAPRKGLKSIRMKKIFFSIIFLWVSFTLSAQVRLPGFFGDNMVLQRDKIIPVWGWASSKEQITVQLNKQTKTVVADKSGKWKVSLDAAPAGGPYQLSIQGKNTLTFNNVLIGDVWVCSGQSNMEWSVKNSKDALAEIQKADYPQIRHFKIPRTIASEPKDNISGGVWQVCTPQTAGDFTAVGYYFARALHTDLKIPIGLLNSSWGGTQVETWTSRDAFENSEEFQTMIAEMPKLNMDSLTKKKLAENKKRTELLKSYLEKDTSEIALWKEMSYVDAVWSKLNVPGIWEDQLLEKVDGVVWFRKSIAVKAVDVGKQAVLELAMIDDSDETYMNGTKIGSTSGYNQTRKYTIPSDVLKEGKNVIAIKITDTGGGGGIWGEADQVKITFANESQSLAGEWLFRVESFSNTQPSISPNAYPTLLSNAMINPLIPFAIKGVIWYQGESNAGRAYQYRKAFPLLINDWRKRWNQGDFPFYFVQLASFNANNGDTKKGSTWAELREAQMLALSLPNTGMAVTTDVGESNDIHPKNKQDVGKRLALLALNATYGKNIVAQGPAYQSMKTEGNKIIISFANIGTGLMAKDKYGYLRGFEIAGEDQQFQYAKAFIEANKVIVYQEALAKPIAVRFGWADDPKDNNLFNKEGFPALPFRSDSWKGITEGVTYKLGN